MHRPALCILLVQVVLLCSCSSQGDKAASQVIGGPGNSDGRFITPRGVSARGDRLWVVDRSGRIQCFDLAGKHLLTILLPKPDGRGYPIGIAALADGGCLVCDTHSSRVLRYDSRGKETLRFGKLGSDAGEFSYPQRALLDGAEIFVSEYGEGINNRVQVFNERGSFLRQFGTFGTGPGQFTRCMGMAIVGRELFIADASDRVLVFSREGSFLREFGRNGSGPGEFRYPYGISSDGETIFVAEYGGHRVQKLSLHGECLGCYGACGSGEGDLSGPWDVCADSSMLYIADTGNHRVVRIDPARGGWYIPAP